MTQLCLQACGCGVGLQLPYSLLSCRLVNWSLAISLHYRWGGCLVGHNDGHNAPKVSLAICRASARPPAFLSTMSHIPSSLEGMRSRKALNRYRSLNVANDLGRIQDSHCWVCLSQSEAFPPLSLGCSDIARECDITLHIKGECVHMLEALGTWSLYRRLRAL